MFTSGLLLVLSLPIIAQLAGATQNPAFEAFIAKHGRTYRHGTEEYKKRIAIFAQRGAEVAAHNSQPGRLWRAGLNSLSDRTEGELVQLRGWRGGAAPGRTAGAVQPHGRGLFLRQTSRAQPVPEEFMNWTSLATAKDIADQGACGSCWAVSTALVLSTHAEIYTEHPRKFSAQELVSCVPNPQSCGGDGGCKGATVELALDYVLRQGLATEAEEPYAGEDTTCKKAVQDAALSSSLVAENDLSSVGVRTSTSGALSGGASFGMYGWERLPENRYEPLLRAVVERGPVGVSVSAATWANYDSGIFDGCDKDAVIDHAVVLLGFGRDKDLNAKYWLIQNSWGEYWGENGHIRLLRRDSEETEHCGIDKQPEVGTGCKGGPTEVRVCGMCGILYDTAVPHFNKQLKQLPL